MLGLGYVTSRMWKDKNIAMPMLIIETDHLGEVSCHAKWPLPEDLYVEKAKPPSSSQKHQSTKLEKPSVR